jgi:hypothetical protein
LASVPAGLLPSLMRRHNSGQRACWLVAKSNAQTRFWPACLLACCQVHCADTRGLTRSRGLSTVKEIQFCLCADTLQGNKNNNKNKGYSVCLCADFTLV